jgi:hypothetical protein
MGATSGQEKRSELRGDCGTPHRTHLFREYKLFRVQRKLDPDEQMWLTLFLGTLLLVLVIWLLGRMH